MKNTWLLFILMLIGIAYSCNQPTTSDSSQSILEEGNSIPLDSIKLLLTDTNEDTTQLNVLLAIIGRYGEEGDINEIEPFVKEALDKANKLLKIDNSLLDKTNLVIGETFTKKGHSKKGIPYLEKVIENKNGKYLVLAYKQLAYAYVDAGYEDKALEFCDSVINNADKNKDFKIIGDAKVTQGIIFRRKGEPEKSISLIKEAEGYLEKLENDTKLTHVYNSLGRAYRAMSEYDTAMYYYQKNLKIDKAIGDKVNESKTYNNIGNIYQDLGELDKALESYLSSLKLKEKIGNKKSTSIAYHNIGAIRKDLKDYDVAMQDFKKSMELAKEVDFKIVIIHNYLKIGNVNREIGKLEEAIKDHEIALQLSEESNFSVGLIEAYNSLGKDYLKLKKYNQSLNYLFTGLDLAEEAKDKSNISIALLDIAKVYMAVDSLENKEEFFSAINSKTSETESFLLKGYQMSKEISDAKTVFGSLNALKIFYRNNNNLEKELIYSREYILLKDSLFSDNKADAIADYETQYKTGEKDKEITLLEKENILVEREKALLTTRNNYYLAIAGLLLAFLIIGSYLFLQIRKSKRKIESQNDELQKLNTTKDKFFGIIAHDIRSPIAALDGVGEQMEYYIKKDKKDRLVRLAANVDSTAKRLSSLLDNLLNWALLQQGVIPYHPKQLNVSETVDSIKDMFQNNAEAKGVQLISEIDPNLAIMADEPALQTILRNLVSNAIKFTTTDGTVSIHSELKNDMVFLHIKDSGTGMSKKAVNKLFSLQKKSKKGTAGEKGTGLGLNLVKELVELNKGEINVESELGKGSRFSVGLPKG